MAGEALELLFGSPVLLGAVFLNLPTLAFETDGRTDNADSLTRMIAATADYDRRGQTDFLWRKPSNGYNAN